jgi:hypothetical protein
MYIGGGILGVLLIVGYVFPLRNPLSLSGRQGAH